MRCVCGGCGCFEELSSEEVRCRSEVECGAEESLEEDAVDEVEEVDVDRRRSINITGIAAGLPVLDEEERERLIMGSEEGSSSL